MLLTRTTFAALSLGGRRVEAGAVDPACGPAAVPSGGAAMVEAALKFVDGFGTEADALGWTAPQLFGVHPQHGKLRTDWCGMLMLSRQKATGVDARRVAFGNTGAYHDTFGAPVGVPIWEFAAKQRAR
jgi:hypothetical protein